MGLIERKKGTGDWGLGIGNWRIVDSSSPFPMLHSLFPVFFIFFISSFTIFPQNTASLVSETARLERLSLGGQTSQERFNALFSLARLHQLSGNPLEAIKSLDGALAVIPGDRRALFEKGRLFISLGEYEKAVETATTLLARGNEKECLLLGRFLIAQLEAFRSGDVLPLAALASESDFSEYLNSIYYTIWKLGDLPAWKIRLTTEFPLSPEAKITGSKVALASTPLWLLFPGREGVYYPAPNSNDDVTPPAVTVTNAASDNTVIQASFLQTGLFSSEGNARSQAERLVNAGFGPQIRSRLVNGRDHWVVIVSGGNDINATIKKLKDAGFDSFPVDP